MRQRPDHPDLLALIQIVDAYDNDLGDEVGDEAKQRVFQMIAKDKVDVEAASYVAFQRARRAFNAKDLKAMTAHLGELAAGSTLWLEGVIVGVELERRRQGTGTRIRSEPP